MISRSRVMADLRIGFLFVSLLFAGLSTSAMGQATSARTEAQNGPFAVEYYYKVKWGYADEFIALFKKNHYPLLNKQVEMGRMLQVSAVAPRYHMTENGRWDYRVTIVFKNAAVANDGFDEKALIQEMY